MKVNNNIPEWKLVVPKGYRREVLASCHDIPNTGHLGIFKTLCRIRKFYYWPKFKTYVNNYVQHCRTCGAQKKSTTNYKSGVQRGA